jgi:tetratricopeptide (TPR) repeat protein
MLAFVFLWAMPQARADILTLHDGRWIEGKVEEEGDIVKLRLKHGSIEIPAHKIKNILKEAEGKLSRKQQKERESIEKAIEAMRSHSEWRNKYTNETKHFVFHYNVTPEIAQGYIDMLEGFYKNFCKKLGVRLGPGVKRKKMEINIFRDRENYAQVGGSRYSLGHWNFVDERLFFYHDRNDPDFTLSVLLHEFTHLLTHLIKPKFCHPIWCNEGIAEYFGGSKRDGTKLIFGGMQEGRLVAMKKWREEGNDYHLEELMRIPPNAFGGLEYAWAWTFVHFMLEHPKYQKKFMKYYVGLAKDSGVKREEDFYYYPTVKSYEDVAYFKKCFGIRNLDKLNDEWHAYIDANLEVTTGAGYLREAMTLYYKDDHDKALEAITSAEEKWEGSPNPSLFLTKGRILMDMEKYKQAKTAFSAAIELDPLNGWGYYYLGDSMEEMEKASLKEEYRRFKRLAREVSPGDWKLRNRVERDEKHWKKKDKEEEEED